MSELKPAAADDESEEAEAPPPPSLALKCLVAIPMLIFFGTFYIPVSVSPKVVTAFQEMNLGPLPALTQSVLDFSDMCLKLWVLVAIVMCIFVRIYFRWICNSQLRMRNFALVMAFSAIMKIGITVYALELPNKVLSERIGE